MEFEVPPVVGIQLSLKCVSELSLARSLGEGLLSLTGDTFRLNSPVLALPLTCVSLGLARVRLETWLGFHRLPPTRGEKTRAYHETFSLSTPRFFCLRAIYPPRRGGFALSARSKNARARELRRSLE